MTVSPTTVILFDLDGTLLDPAGAITEGISDAIAMHGFDRPDPETLRKFVGPPTDVSLARYTSIPRERHQDILTTYREGYLERARSVSVLYPGMRSLLQELSTLPVWVGIATQKPLPTTRTLLDDFGMSNYFDVVSGAWDALKPETHDLPRDKAGVIERALRQVKDDAEARGDAVELSGVMVGDREYDVTGAAHNGLPCIGVTWGFGGPEELEAAGADPIVDDSASLRAALRDMTGIPLAP
ncbi:HAD hydrolase-like protein [uncultured Kocuria sp.]|uniref:HAD hydrolase-like protein n=1 Tax=uncultured Kocuria sp. TaxID=259305 RepID=UPI002598C32A|nr:HAD hydrolase-like protein [uncultured Kocuria sp.]MCT1367473.1 HAD hydrolase-like protein [Rothia sp. p3-SID1597]